MDNLKPCPFCGSKPKIKHDLNGLNSLFYQIKHDCMCLLSEIKTFNYGTEDEVVSAWNHRPDFWIPVTEQLPESGKHVLLCCEVRPAMKRYICDGYYAKAKSIINSCSFDYECAVEYDEEQDEYFLLEGFYEVIKNWDEYTSITIEDFVTHWMPLPEPPESGLEVQP